MEQLGHKTTLTNFEHNIFLTVALAGLVGWIQPVAVIKVRAPLVRPDVDHANPIASIYLIAFFIIKESSDVFECICNGAPHPRSLESLTWAAIFSTTLATAIAFLRRKTVGGFYLGQAFSRQYIADVYWTSCINKENVWDLYKGKTELINF